MDARKIIEKLKGEADRERVSLYLSRSVLNEFRATCKGMAPSRVMEELMKDFIESNRPIKKTATKKASKK